jgi:hypothetical protein
LRRDHLAALPPKGKKRKSKTVKVGYITTDHGCHEMVNGYLVHPCDICDPV